MHDLWEIWYTVDNIHRVVLKPSEEAAVQAGAKLFLDDKAVFDYLIGPGGELRNDLVFGAIKDEQRKRGKDKMKPWVVEVKAAHRDDFWAVVSEHPNEESAKAAIPQLVLQLGGWRVRARQL